MTADAPEAPEAASPPPATSSSSKPDAGAAAGVGTAGGSEAPAFSSSGHEVFDGAAKDYEQGRETLRPPVAATYVSGGHDQQVHVGDRFYYHARSPVAEPGEVREEQLMLLRDRYVQVPNYDQICEDLQKTRLLVLVGSPGSGRSTTALHLLDALTNGKVRRLEPEIDIRSIDESMVGKRRGSLAVLSGPTIPPTKAQADRLAALLARQGSFCVVVATPTPLSCEHLLTIGLTAHLRLLPHYCGVTSKRTSPPRTPWAPWTTLSRSPWVQNCRRQWPPRRGHPR